MNGRFTWEKLLNALFSGVYAFVVAMIVFKGPSEIAKSGGWTEAMYQPLGQAILTFLGTLGYQARSAEK